MKTQSFTFASTLAAALACTALAAAEGDSHPQQGSSSSDVQKTAGESSSGSTAMGGMNSDQVRQAQRELSSRGLYRGSIDGIAGAQFKQALTRFQAQQGLPVNGRIDTRTSKALGIQSERLPVSGSDVQQTRKTGTADVAQHSSSMGQNRSDSQMDSSDVERQVGSERGSIQLSSLNGSEARQLQTRLRELGFYQGELDGIAGQQTRLALQRYFQHQSELAMQGELDQSLLSSLGVNLTSRAAVSGSDAPTTSRPQSSTSGTPSKTTTTTTTTTK